MAEITAEFLNKLKELAQKVTAGPWAYGTCDIDSDTWGVGCFEDDDQNPIVGFISNSSIFPLETVATEVQGRYNAAYIAAANPQVVLTLISEIERLRHKEDFYIKAMAEYHQVAKMAWDGEIPSPLPGHESSEEKMIEQVEYLNCPACGGSGQVGDCDEAVQNLKCDIENLRKENEELHANNYGPEILNDPQALTASYFAGAMAEGRKRDAEIETLEKEADWLAMELEKREHGCEWCGMNNCSRHTSPCGYQGPDNWREAARKAVEGNTK